MNEIVMSTPTRRVMQILTALADVGLSIDEILSASGFSILIDELAAGNSKTLSRRDCNTIAGIAVRAVETEAAHRCGVSPPPADLHLAIGQSVTSCGTLGHVIGSLQMLGSILGGTAGIMPGTVQHDSENCSFILGTARTLEDPVNFLADLFLVISMRNMFAWALRKAVSLSSASFTYPDTFARFIPEGFVQFPILWDQPRLSISLPARLIEGRVARTEVDLPALLAIVPLMMGETDELGRITSAINQILDEAIARRAPIPGAPEMARELGCSSATLRRKVGEEGTTFRALKCGRRAHWATLLLRLHPIADVAQQLGFGDETAFSRAFRQWTGEVPSSYRPKPRRL